MYLISERLEHHPVTPGLRTACLLWPFGQCRLQELQESKDITVSVKGTNLYSDPNRDYFLISTSAVASHWLACLTQTRCSLSIMQTSFATSAPKEHSNMTTACWRKILTVAILKKYKQYPVVHIKINFMLMTYRFLKAFRWRAWNSKYMHFFPLLWSPIRMSAQGK